MAQLSTSAGQFAMAARTRAGLHWRRIARVHATRALARIPSGARIHMGCGEIKLEGWINLDLGRRTEADLRIDLRGGLPLRPQSVARIYSEHVLEHLSIEDGQTLLTDCFNALEPDGVMRIAMPDLKSLVEAYLGNWRDQEWLDNPGYSHIDSASRMLNAGFRYWGHRYLYDQEDLSLRLSTAGFSQIRRCDWGESDFPDLCKLERRPDSLLIVEAYR
jgi:predicted SAM-dependent methyltransferase